MAGVATTASPATHISAGVLRVSGGKHSFLKETTQCEPLDCLEFAALGIVVSPAVHASRCCGETGSA